MTVYDELMRAEWTMAPSCLAAPVFTRNFSARSCEKAEIAITAFGFFKLYINGKKVGSEYILPLHSIYHDIGFSLMEYPIKDTLTFRVYCSVFDISQLLVDGDNLLEIHLANGFYRQTERIAEGDWKYGDELGVRYAIIISDSDNSRSIISDCTEVVRNSAITYSELFVGEVYDARIERDREYQYYPTFRKGFPDTLITLADAPSDEVISEIIPTLIYKSADKCIYDLDVNVSGIVKIRAYPKDGERVILRFSETFTDGELDFDSTGAQYACRSGKQQIMEDVFIGDGNEHIYQPSFVWHAFRYFEIVGDADVVCVSVIHAPCEITSCFTSSSDELNWLYNAFIRTQLNNMHLGFPSDCPHRERLGYTGDGQICSSASMMLLDSQDFYRKWIRDIFDSQDQVGGHVNHTAPFGGGGGGPLGWGGAAITVPYNYYKIFGDITPVKENYTNMKGYVGYILSRMDAGLVVREENGGWVLGDWCTLDECKIPEPLVNTALFAKYLDYMIEIADALGKSDDTLKFSEIKKRSMRALKEKYFNDIDGSFFDGIQGADCFGIYSGASDKRTEELLIKRYSKQDCFDTGFIGTYILVELLFELGAEDEAYKLLTSHEPGSFGYMMDRKATTVWEHWRGEGSRNHPMFGACAVHLFSELLGITQAKKSYGYERIEIRPHIPRALRSASGSILTPKGRISVAFEQTNDAIGFVIDIPEGETAEFVFKEEKRLLNKNKNNFTIEV